MVTDDKIMVTDLGENLLYNDDIGKGRRMLVHKAPILSKQENSQNNFKIKNISSTHL